MKKLSLLMTLTIALSSCTNASLQPTATPTTQATATITATSTTTPTSTATVTPSPTNTPEAQKFCDYNDAMKAVEYIDEMTVVESDSKPLIEDMATMTAAEVQLMISAINLNIENLDQLIVPECLTETILHLRSSYSYYLDMFVNLYSKESDYLFNQLMLSSEEYQQFETEYQRVKECIPTGCQ